MSQVEERLTSEDVDEPEVSIRFSDARRQIVFSCLSFSLVIQVGTSLSYSSVLLPQLGADGSDIKVTKDQASWIASLVTIMVPVGSLLAGPCMDKYGRKKLSALSGIPFIAGWMTAALATDVSHLYLFRILTGLGSGFSTVCLVYCSEITHPTYRPMLLGLNSVFVSLGILMTCTLGVVVPWRLQAVVHCTLSLLTVLLHWPLPESPHWLPTQTQAEMSLSKLYQRRDVYRGQLRALLRERERGTQTITSSGLKSCLTPIVYKPVFLLISIFLFQQLTGAYVVIFYAVNIFREIKVQYEDLSLVMFGVIRFFMAVISLLLSRVFGRRPLLFISGVGMCVSCIIAFFLRHTYEQTTSVAICVLVYVCFGALGFLGIPWTLIGELLPVKIKGLASGCMITVAYIFMFVIVKLFPLVMDVISIQYIFLIFSCNSLFAVLIVYLWLPETFGVSFSEIEKHFQS